jgi:hypothetical protein
MAGPAAHPSCAIAHTNDNTPDPITIVTMRTLASHMFDYRHPTTSPLFPTSTETSNTTFTFCTISSR